MQRFSKGDTVRVVHDLLGRDGRLIAAAGTEGIVLETDGVLRPDVTVDVNGEHVRTYAYNVTES